MSAPKPKWKQMTPTLFFSCLIFLQGALLFGIDTGSFGSLQALPSFLERFGVQNAAGAYKLPATRTSLMNSLPWIGKFAGCLGSESIIDRFGYKKAMYMGGFVQIIAIIIELTAHTWPQFTVGRIIAYSAVGLVENAVPSYSAEVSPAALRGLLSGSIMFITGLGNLWGTGMSRAYATTTAQSGWMIPTSMQLIPAVLLLALVPWTPESPRWLLLMAGRKEEAQNALDRLRPADDVKNGATRAEIEALEGVMKEEEEAAICVTLFVLEQTNGNQFIQSYAATFYVDQGQGSKSFTYSMIGQVVGILGAAFCILLIDITGRRPLMVGGSIGCTVLLFLAAGLGTVTDLSTSGANVVLACFMLLPAFTRISASTNAFLTGAEIGGVKMRKKIMAFGTCCGVAAAFLVTFVTPYLLPSMGINIGWIFGSVAAFSVVWSYFFYPELKGRSLEDVDELFEARLPARRFATYETHGAGRILTEIENSGLPGMQHSKKLDHGNVVLQEEEA
ncbi:general substrate transporter [Coniella lustricola]|uniref:General substrate transporter n=1 Tax=Coniella lustricola TaxID=2025994 RepID=A0A2T2ZW47_9PEZI|nr:general substrate transporter [Coniella lustricola]